MHPALRPSDSLLPRASNTASILFRSRAANYANPRTVQPDLARLYATYRDVGGDSKGPSASSSRPKKRGVGLLADDGRYQWGDLTGREKVARATQQSVNFAVVCVGAVLTVSLAWLGYILLGDIGLTENREACFTYSGRKSFLPIARHGSLRKRLGASRMTRGVRLCLVNGDR